MSADEHIFMHYDGAIELSIAPIKESLTSVSCVACQSASAASAGKNAESKYQTYINHFIDFLFHRCESFHEGFARAFNGLQFNNKLF